MFIKLIKFIGFATLVALVYIHMQMQIIDLAYQGKQKEKDIHKLIEQNGNITYTILTLKSANNIGIKMFAEDSDMEFVDPRHILQVSTIEQVQEPERLATRFKSVKNKASILSLMSLVSKAEAKP